MRNKIIYFLSGIIAVMLAACQPKPIDIDVQPAQPKLVISSQVIPNKIMIVMVTRSFSALSGKGAQDADTVSQNFLNDILVKNALVTVSYLGNTDTLFMLSAGVYASINTLQYIYGSYTLHVLDVETGLEVSSSTTLLPKVSFDTVYPIVIKDPGDTVVDVYYELSDNTSEENYYVVNYIKKVNGANSPGIDINQVFSLGSNYFQSYFDLLNDASFNNGKFSTRKRLEKVTRQDSIAVMVSHISKGYYDFLSSFKRSGSFINLLTGEPINYPTNVEGGYGYFNAHYPNTRYFDLKTY
ncbi:MAG: DUF4249 domain-containing protein [Bacteroidia bacterium]